MNETQKRIKAYQDALPGLRERVIAVALLLVVSLTMATSATFAWLTISKHPEATGASTTVAANGNLEIALASADGAAPGESQVGDSSAALGQSIAVSNLTWGNLVNLSDSTYGLENIVLRPALLGDTSNLLNTPLVSVNYGGDGRVDSGYNEDFGFTNWNAERGFFEYYQTPQYGVRAVSTIEYKVQDSTTEEYRTLLKAANSANQNARNLYRDIIGPNTPANNDPDNHNANIKAIAGLMGDYMTAKLNGELATFEVTGYVEVLYHLMRDFREAYYAAGDALAALANVQVFNTYGVTEYKAHLYTEEDLWDADKLARDGVTLDSLRQYKTDITTLNADIAKMETYYTRVTTTTEAVLWSEVESIVNNIVKISTCTVAANANATPVQIGSLGKSAAISLLGSNPYAVLHDGMLKNFEQLTGERMNMTAVEVSATYMMTITMEAKSITTAAAEPYGYYSDRDNYCVLGGASNLEGSAADTYGMVVDLWARTNAAGSYLVLEGNVLTREEEPVPATLTLPGGEVVSLYSATVTYPENESDTGTEDDPLSGLLGNTQTVDVYPRTVTIEDSEGNSVEETVWYFADNYAPVYTTDENENVIPTRGESVEISENPKMITPITIIGYEGENRVWENADDMIASEQLSVNNTTQGSGSCYVFYADNPTEQENSLKLLANLRVAFLNADGRLVAKAALDTNLAYEDSGKVTIPLFLIDDGTISQISYCGEDLAILPLQQNEATRLTMIVYLEGSTISNEQVLAAGEIQGQLNVQFGSSVSLRTLGDTALQEAEWSVSATVSPTYHDFEDAADDMTSRVTVRVDGITPANVTAFFIRQVNSMQGSREVEMTFTSNGDGTWSADHTFRAPGNYILRSVQLDGQEYDLTTRPEVQVEGLSIGTVNCSAFSDSMTAAVLTGNNTYSATVSTSVASDNADLLPNSVQVQFVDEENGTMVTVPLHYNADTWTGTANFTASGSYTMKYVITDGYYTELPSASQKTLNLTLGVKVRVLDNIIDGVRTFEYDGTTRTIGMAAEIFDESGEILGGLQNVRLYYGKSGSFTDGLDTDLTWDADEERYFGNFQLVTPGIYAFNYLLVGDSVVTNTEGTLPVYTLVSPNPPVLMTESCAAESSYVLLLPGSTSGDTYVGVQIGYADSATVTGVFTNTENPSAEPVTVIGTKVENSAASTDEMTVYDVSFKVPAADGTWQLTELWLSGVCDTDGVYHGDNDPWVWNMEEDYGLTTELTTKVDILHVGASVSLSSTTAYGGDTTPFLTAVAADATEFIFEIGDSTGKALEGSVSDISFTYRYKANSSSSYGGYTASHLSDAEYGTGEIFHLTARANTGTAEGMAAAYNYIPGSAMTMLYAGLYEAYTLSFSIDGATYYYGPANSGIDGTRLGDMPSAMSTLSLTTATPSVAITAISPTGTFNVDKDVSGSIEDSSTYEQSGSVYYRSYRYYWITNGSHTANYTPNSDSTTATVYFKCDHTNTTNYGYTSWYSGTVVGLVAAAAAAADNVDYHDYTQPSVSIRMTGIGEAANAALTFALPAGSSENTVRLYETGGGTTATSSFSWTSDSTCVRYVGSYTASSSNDTKVPAGTLTATTIVLTDSLSNSYTVDLGNNDIVISNPH